MKTIGLSPLELRSILEHAFLPSHCVCEHSANGTLALHIEDPATGRVELQVQDISTDRFSSSREISDLIAQLRGQLEAARKPQRARQLYHA